MSPEKGSKVVLPDLEQLMLNMRNLLVFQVLLVTSFLLIGWAFYPQEYPNVITYDFHVRNEEITGVSANITTVEDVLEEEGYSGEFFFYPREESNSTGGSFELLLRTGWEHYLTFCLEGKVNASGNFTELGFSGVIANGTSSLFWNFDPRADDEISYRDVYEKMEEDMSGICEALNLTGNLISDPWTDSDEDYMCDLWLTWCSFCCFQVLLIGLGIVCWDSKRQRPRLRSLQPTMLQSPPPVDHYTPEQYLVWQQRQGAQVQVEEGSLEPVDLEEPEQGSRDKNETDSPKAAKPRL